MSPGMRSRFLLVLPLAALALLAWPSGALSSSPEDIPTIVPRAISQEPIKLEAVSLGDQPTVDGRSREWEDVSETIIPLWPTVVRDPDNYLGPVDLRMKAGVFKETLYLMLNWPDPLPNATHQSWVWDFTMNRYREGDDLEDRLALRFGLNEGFTACPLSGKAQLADLWIWRAARSNPVGYALDAVHVVKDSPISDGHPWRLPDGSVHWIGIRPDKGGDFTYTLSYSSYKGDIVPRFIVKKAEKLSGSRKDVEAKGIWLEGFWTLELARALDTGNSDDIAFRLGDVVELSISASSRGEGAHESVSPLIKLILPQPTGKQTASR